MLDNEELIEEGVGFGVPVVKYKDKTYFSSSAEVTIQKNKSTSCIIKKRFILDTISRKRFWKASYINDKLYSSLRKIFEKFYVHNSNFITISNRIMELRTILKIKTEFIRVKPRGAITISYQCQPTKINISFDSSKLNLKNCQEILALNEQGSTTFRKYADTNGLKLIENKIGAWAPVEADEASLLNAKDEVSFALQKINGATLFRGWEKTRNRFSWAGLSYSLHPNHGTFDYDIKLNFKSKNYNSAK